MRTRVNPLSMTAGERDLLLPAGWGAGAARGAVYGTAGVGGSQRRGGPFRRRGRRHVAGSSIIGTVSGSSSAAFPGSRYSDLASGGHWGASCRQVGRHGFGPGFVTRGSSGILTCRPAPPSSPLCPWRLAARPSGRSRRERPATRHREANDSPCPLTPLGRFQFFPVGRLPGRPDGRKAVLRKARYYLRTPQSGDFHPLGTE